MTLEQQIEAIAERVAEQKMIPLHRKIQVLEAQVKASGDRLTTAEAKARTGISDTRTLLKRFTPVEKNGTYTWSAAEIAEWITKQELTKSQAA